MNLRQQATEVATTHQTITLQGAELSYTANVQEWLLLDDKDKEEASIVTYSYIKDGTAAERELRPLLFAYNGGPGSSCVWLHLGFTAPTRVKLADAVNPAPLPPYALETNPYTLLDSCDIVMIDPVGTGYARLLLPEAAAKYYNVDGDAASVAAVIEAWLNHRQRWQSPRYLMGESYGTVRSGYLVKELMGGPFSANGRCTAIGISGVILLGTAGLGGRNSAAIEPCVLNLPTYAATHWYHHLGRQQAMDPDYLADAFAFSHEEYLPALFLGTRLAAAKRRAVAERLAYFTGLDVDWLLQQQLRFTTQEFISMCCRQEGLDVGLYDGRYTAAHQGTAGTADPVADDAAMGKYTPAFIGAMNAAKKAELSITWDREYHAINFGGVNAKFKMESQAHASSLQCLVAGMRRNAEMRIFFGSGYYDLVTVLGYPRLLASLGSLPVERLILKEYDSGHMPYLGDASAAQLSADLHNFIAGA